MNWPEHNVVSSIFRKSFVDALNFSAMITSTAGDTSTVHSCTISEPVQFKNNAVFPG